MFWNGLFILINGYTVFFEWDTARFLTSCMLVLPSYPHVDILTIPLDLNIPIFFGLYFVYKIPNKSRFWRASEMDFVTVCGSFICFAITIDTAVHDRISQVLKKRKSIRIDPIHFCNALQMPYFRFLIMRRDIAILVSCIVVHGKIFAIKLRIRYALIEVLDLARTWGKAHESEMISDLATFRRRE